METKTALITGITGQDGSFLAELLLNKGYDVYGLVRRLSKPNLGNIEHIVDSINLIDGDLADQASIINAVKETCPDELYNLAAQSFVATSWQQAEFTCNITGLGAYRVFEAARMVGKYIKGEEPRNNIKVYQAASSEQFGNVPIPQNENSSMVPRSPYAAAKVFAYNMARIYRESYGMYISCGICFNHTSERRGIEFVSRKISDGVARIKLGLNKELKLGNLNSKRDWSYAKDIIEGMWLMLQQDISDDFILSSGEPHSVEEFVETAFKYVGLEWKDYVKIDKALMRPAEVFELRGDYSKAEKILGWKPKTNFENLVKLMVDNDLNMLKKTDMKRIE